MLTVTVMVSAINSALPKTSYMKSIDYFLALCFLMVLFVYFILYFQVLLEC